MKLAIQIVVLVLAGLVGILLVIRFGDFMFNDKPEDFKSTVLYNCRTVDRPEEPYGLCVERAWNAIKP